MLRCLQGLGALVFKIIFEIESFKYGGCKIIIKS